MRKKVLLVDDEEGVLALLSATLEGDSRYTLVVAHNGQEAMAVAHREKPDLLLLDIRMPGMDGYQVCRKLKSDPETASIAVVMLTALAQDADRQRALEVGADGYVTKPFSPQGLRSKVEQLLFPVT